MSRRCSTITVWARPCFNAVTSHDIPVLQGAVLLVGIVYMVSTLLADVFIAFLNPRVRLETTR